MFVKMIRICQVILNYKRLSDGHHFNNVHQSLTCICHYINTICTSTNFKKGRKNKIPHLVLTFMYTLLHTHILIHSHTHTQMHPHAHTCIHTYIHTHIQMHPHTHKIHQYVGVDV